MAFSRSNDAIRNTKLQRRKKKAKQERKPFPKVEDFWGIDIRAFFFLEVPIMKVSRDGLDDGASISEKVAARSIFHVTEKECSGSAGEKGPREIIGQTQRG